MGLSLAPSSARGETPKLAAGSYAAAVDLPMAPSCALDEAGLGLQLERYRQAGRNARLIKRTSRCLATELDTDVDLELVSQAIEVERACCPFFILDWEPARRRLTVSVSEAEQEPALDAIAFALGLQRPD
jgi:hypothetical protein